MESSKELQFAIISERPTVRQMIDPDALKSMDKTLFNSEGEV
ncbi:MAG: hypothetical protein OCD03_16345 [Hyphomicrobiales bacterium]